jgi:hypothetical protein
MLVYGLMGSHGLVEDQIGMSKIAVDFYKKLFAAEETEGVLLCTDFWEEEDLVKQEENDYLDVPFSESEIRDAVFSSYSEGAPGPDGLPFLFYQKF